jgi:hypothetical protein
MTRSCQASSRDAPVEMRRIGEESAPSIEGHDGGSGSRVAVDFCERFRRAGRDRQRGVWALGGVAPTRAEPASSRAASLASRSQKEEA